jgi:hypothetical protein
MSAMRRNLEAVSIILASAAIRAADPVKQRPCQP